MDGAWSDSSNTLQDWQQRYSAGAVQPGVKTATMHCGYREIRLLYEKGRLYALRDDRRSVVGQPEVS